MDSQDAKEKVPCNCSPEGCDAGFVRDTNKKYIEKDFYTELHELMKKHGVKAKVRHYDKDDKIGLAIHVNAIYDEEADSFYVEDK